MKVRTQVPWSLALTLFLIGCAPLVAGPSRVLPRELQYDPADYAGQPTPHPTSPPHHFTHPNGLEVFWDEDHAAPLVDVMLLVRCGRGDEPLGAPSLTSYVLSFALEAGAGALDGPAQRRAFERVGGDADIHEDDGESWATMTVRTEDLPATLALVREALASPHFEEATVAIERDRRANALEAPAAKHGQLARQTRQRALYGSVPSLSQVQTAATVRAITAAQLRAHASACLQPPNLVLSVTGDVTEASVRAAVAPFATLGGATRVAHLPAVPAPATRSTWLVPSKVTNKVEVMLLGPGLPPGSPQRAAAQVLMAVVLSSLLSDLREELGGIYSVSGDVDVGPGNGATWISFSTRHEVAFEAVRRALALLQFWWDRWPVDDQVVDSLTKALQWRARSQTISERTQAAARARMQDGERYDPRTLEEQLAAVKFQDVRAFFVQALRPDRLQVVVSGAFDPKLDWASLGPVTRVEQ
jgi:predicted Zn-dependent peptidase